MTRTPLFFSSKRSGLILGAALGVSTLLMGATFAQSLTIPNAIENTAITIKKIFLSPTGTIQGNGSSIELNGQDGILNVRGETAGGGFNSQGRIVTTNLEVDNDIVFTKLKCLPQNYQVSGPVNEGRYGNGKANPSDTGKGENPKGETTTQTKGENPKGETTTQTKGEDPKGENPREQTKEDPKDRNFSPEDMKTIEEYRKQNKADPDSPLKLRTLIDSGKLSYRQTQLARYVISNGASISDPLDTTNENNYGIYCLLMTDADGNVGLTTDITPWLPSGTFNTVFKRSTTNPQDSYFATASGQPSTVGSSNFLRIGATNNNEETAKKLDAAMVVAGSIESRGGTFIKKIDGQTSNEGDNTQVSFDTNYTSLDTTVEGGNIMLESQRIDSATNPRNTSFLFSAKNAQTKLGINNATPTKTLDVVGNAGVTQYLTVGHPANFVPTTTDKLLVNGSTRANAYYYNSDRRYKSKITLIDNALEKLSTLHGYRYYNKLSQKNDIGVIAQEVEKAFPELVQTDTQGYKSVAYGNLIAPVIQAIQELSGKVTTLTVSMHDLFDKYIDLTSQVKAQQRQIDSLESRIQSLEQAK